MLVWVVLLVGCRSPQLMELTDVANASWELGAPADAGRCVLLEGAGEIWSGTLSDCADCESGYEITDAAEVGEWTWLGNGNVEASCADCTGAAGDPLGGVIAGVWTFSSSDYGLGAEATLLDGDGVTYDLTVCPTDVEPTER